MKEVNSIKELKMKYQPRFKPEIYLRFLNEIEYHIKINKYGENSMAVELWTLLWDDESTCEQRFKGVCLEECLDGAILEMEF